jgi:hypothetical protein
MIFLQRCFQALCDNVAVRISARWLLSRRRKRSRCTSVVAAEIDHDYSVSSQKNYGMQPSLPTSEQEKKVPASTSQVANHIQSKISEQGKKVPVSSREVANHIQSSTSEQGKKVPVSTSQVANHIQSSTSEQVKKVPVSSSQVANHIQSSTSEQGKKVPASTSQVANHIQSTISEQEKKAPASSSQAANHIQSAVSDKMKVKPTESEIEYAMANYLKRSAIRRLRSLVVQRKKNEESDALLQAAANYHNKNVLRQVYFGT